ncbi:Cas1p-domain-containing protein [Mytilinidion resinicola]|uniref:Cas1p-domain-containing protein n=1 Tax=Mytilinidion resinicola TaxID=574789 RepID=A0A6A6Z4Q5_9PEZI|nr:Cas1p-domain-containing protein [Mytilinidion resinicola]KAF2816010.1 Cas1p-domain-containing protein [Mytilinidion resinicola]
MPRIRLLPRFSSPADAFNRTSCLLLLVVLAATLYRRSVIDYQDPHKCQALIRDGQWLDPPKQPFDPDYVDPKRPFQHWNPPGCVLHEYTGPEINRCAETGKILFVGDPGIRQIFWATAKKLDEGKARKEKAGLEKHEDIEFSAAGALLKFVWDPFLTSSRLYEELAEYRESVKNFTKVLDDASAAGSGAPVEVKRKSTVILIGGGHSHARHIHTGNLKDFEDAVDNITSTAYAPHTMTSGKRFPITDDDGIGNQIFFAPVLQPLYDRLSPSRAITMLPEKIDGMNEYLEKLSINQGLNVLWSYANMTAGIDRAYGESGLHVVENVAGRMADVVLNLRCNAKIARQDGYPYDRTCCIDYSPVNWIQLVALICFFFVLSLSAIKAARGMTSNTAARTRFAKSIARQQSNSISANASASTTLALLSVGLCLWYCYLADRTQVFHKIQKQFIKYDFFSFLSAALALGLLTIRGPSSSPGRRRSESFTGTSIRQSFLSRSQTEEWKGWMQLFILIFNFTGATKELWIYEVVRLLASAYIFLTGYGHTMYFLQKKDYSLRRVASVLTRLNVLACSLSFVMRTRYTAYHFISVSSFWFLVIYLTLKIGHRRNDSIAFLLGKIMLSAILVSTIIHLKGILESLLSLLRLTCGITWNATAWRFHLGLDKFIPFVGMLTAILHLHIANLHSYPQLATRSRSLISEMLTDYFSVFHAFLALAAVGLIPVYCMISGSHTNESDYNSWLPYLSPLPILSFAVLRNSTRLLRNYHSAAFAWVGRHSLELYVLQHHLLLAGDGRVLLATGLFAGDGSFWHDRWRDVALLLALFLWFAWRVACATATLTLAVTGDAEAVLVASEAKPVHERKISELRLPDYGNGTPGPGSVAAAAALNATARLEPTGGKKGSSRWWAQSLRRRVVMTLGVLWVLNWLS